MHKMRFVSVLVLLTLLLGAGIITAVGQESLPTQDDVPATATLQPQGEDLQPGVREFIAGSSLSHAADYPDPNEPVEVLKLYLQGIQMLRDGKVNEAVALFKTAVGSYPDCRHAHAGLGRALRQKHQDSQAEDDLRAAVQEFILADEIGMKYGRVHYTRPIAEGLGHLKDSTALDSFFRKALEEGNEPYLASLHYAQGLSVFVK